MPQIEGDIGPTGYEPETGGYGCEFGNEEMRQQCGKRAAWRKRDMDPPSGRTDGWLCDFHARGGE